MSLADVDALLARVLDLAAPPERQPLSAWADQHRILSSEASASPGEWRTHAYQREPLDAIAPGSPYEQVVMVFASQLGKSEMQMNLLAYIIAVEPGPALIVEPTLSMCEAFSKDRLAPMFRDMPVLKGRVADAKAKTGEATMFHRRFMGGHVTLVGSNSAAGLASRPIRYLLLDEVDRFEESAGTEGDAVSLALARTRTFWNRKIIMTSSPFRLLLCLLEHPGEIVTKEQLQARLWPPERSSISSAVSAPLSISSAMPCAIPPPSLGI